MQCQQFTLSRRCACTGSRARITQMRCAHTCLRSCRTYMHLVNPLPACHVVRVQTFLTAINMDECMHSAEHVTQHAGKAEPQSAMQLRTFLGDCLHGKTRQPAVPWYQNPFHPLRRTFLSVLRCRCTAAALPLHLASATCAPRFFMACGHALTWVCAYPVHHHHDRVRFMIHCVCSRLRSYLAHRPACCHGIIAL